MSTTPAVAGFDPTEFLAGPPPARLTVTTDTKDRDIREALTRDLKQLTAGTGGVLIRHELGIRGAIEAPAKGRKRVRKRGTERRIDVAMIAPTEMVGFEIKSDRDTLDRLEGQAETYATVFDTLVLVTTRRYLQPAAALLPDYWGLAIIEEFAGRPGLARFQFEWVREATEHDEMVPLAQAWLLWRDEAYQVARRHSLKPARTGLSAANRLTLCNLLADNLGPAVLAQEVRDILRARRDWRGGDFDIDDGPAT